MTNIQFTLVVITTLILCENTDHLGIIKKWGGRFLLVIVGLTGLLSDLLTPLYYLKAWKYKTRESVIQAAILSVTSLIQLSIFIYSLQFSDFSKRFASGDIPTFGITTLSRTFILPLIGLNPVSSFAQNALNLRGTNFPLYSILGYGALLLLFLIAIVWILPFQNKETTWLALALTIISVFSFLTSITRGDKSILLSPIFAPRYFYAPSIMAYLLFASGIRPSKQWGEKVLSILSISIIAIALIQSISSFSATVSYPTEWPHWRQEVELYKKDPSKTKLFIWPAGKWYVDEGQTP